MTLNLNLLARRVWADPRIPGPRNNPAPSVVVAERRRRRVGSVGTRIAGRFLVDANVITLYAPDLLDKYDATGTLLHEMAHAFLAPDTRHTQTFKWLLAFIEHLYGYDSEGQCLHDWFSAPVCTGWKVTERSYVLCPRQERDR